MGVDYQTYLASREWSLLREQVRERSGNQCERCWHAPQQAVHHMTYENVGHESLDELLAVCNPCHAWLSGKSDRDPAATRLGAVAFSPVDGHGLRGMLFPGDAPRWGLQPCRRDEVLPISRFAFCDTVHRLINQTWFDGYHSATDDAPENHTFVTPDVAAAAGQLAETTVGATIGEAWVAFLRNMTITRRDSWRFVPDERFDIYGDRA